MLQTTNKKNVLRQLLLFRDVGTVTQFSVTREGSASEGKMSDKDFVFLKNIRACSRKMHSMQMQIVRNSFSSVACLGLLETRLNSSSGNASKCLKFSSTEPIHQCHQGRASETLLLRSAGKKSVLTSSRDIRLENKAPR